jgi:hypothetical protein
MAEIFNNQTVLCQIANCAFDVVGNLLNRDQLLAKELRSSKTRSRQIFREECITLEMASTLKERFPNEVELIIFTPHEEAYSTGADWYWHIRNGNSGIHARVQAKRVQRSEFGQPDSDGTIEFETNQLRRLVRAVDRDRSKLPGLEAWIATFARYEATPPCGMEPSKCKNHGCGNNCAETNRFPSIWIAKAQRFATRMTPRRQMMGLRQVVEKSVRLDCILPCSDVVDRGRGGPVSKGFVLEPGLSLFDVCIETIQNQPALLNTFQGAIQIKI